MNKDFLNNCYKSEKDLPAYRFYEAFNDISKLLKDDTKEISEVQRAFLHLKLSELYTYIYKELDEEGYKHEQNQKDKKEKLLIKLAFVNGFHQLLTTLKKVLKIDDAKIEDILEEEKINYIKEVLAGYNIPIRIMLNDQIKTLDRGMKGISFDLGLLEKKKQEEHNFNYIKQYVVITQNVKLRPPYEVSLSEWVQANKIQKEIDNAKQH